MEITKIKLRRNLKTLDIEMDVYYQDSVIKRHIVKPTYSEDHYTLILDIQKTADTAKSEPCKFALVHNLLRFFLK